MQTPPFTPDTPRRLNVRTVIIEVPVTQAGVVQVLPVRLPANAVRLIGILTSNAVTDQPLHTNLYFFGPGPATVSENFLLTGVGRAVLEDGFRYFDVTSSSAVQTVFACPVRLGVPVFRNEAGAVLAFVKSGEVVVNDADLGVSEAYAIYQSTASTSGQRRVFVTGLNLSGRPAAVPVSIAAPPIA